jgi:uncharacterized protein
VEVFVSVRGWTERHDVVLFFVLAYLLSWSIWPLMLLNSESSPMTPFGPLLAALLLTAVVSGWRGIAALVKPLGRWRVHPAWYLIALLGPFALTGLSGVAAVLLGARSPGWGVYSDWLGLATTIVATMVVVGLFEEPGWRGYALPRMQRNQSALWAALVLGVIWALWHLPEMVGDPGEREPIPYILSVVAESVLLAWIYNSTRGSLLLVIVFHGAVNTAAKFLLPEFDGVSRLIAWWTYAASFVLAAGAVVAVAGAERLTTSLSRNDGPAVGRAAGHRRTPGAGRRTG